MPVHSRPTGGGKASGPGGKSHRKEEPAPVAAAAAAANDEEEEQEEEDSDFEGLSMTSSEMRQFIAEHGEEDEEDEEDEEEGDSGDDDDEDDAEDIPVDFDVRDMFTRHIPALSGFIDTSIPDGENLVDRHDFAACLKHAGMHTSLVTVTQAEEDDDSQASFDSAEVVEDEDVYGVISFVPVGQIAASSSSSSTTSACCCKGLLEVLSRTPEHVLGTGTTPVRLLRTTSSGESAKAVLLFNDHLPVLPANITGQLFAHTVEAFLADVTSGSTSPQASVSHIVVLCRVQRSASSDEPTKKTPAKQSKASNEAFDIAACFFARWEEEVLYRHRDPRLSAPVHRFPRYVENQAEEDVPRCVAIGLTVEGLRKATKEVVATAAKLSRIQMAAT